MRNLGVKQGAVERFIDLKEEIIYTAVKYDVELPRFECRYEIYDCMVVPYILVVFVLTYSFSHSPVFWEWTYIHTSACTAGIYEYVAVSHS